jgi:phage protein D
MIVAEPKFTITYNGKNISEDISRYMISLDYTDHAEGETDEISITLDDTDDLWTGAWYPEKKAKLVLDIEYRGKTLKCGTFEIDEIEIGGPPATCTIRAIAAGVSKATRTKRSKPYENQTLKQIADTIAGTYGMKVVGNIKPIKIERITQHQKKDLGFLRELAMEYGYVFSVRDNQLVFTLQSELEGKAEITEIDRTEVASYSFRDKAVEVYKEAKVSYYKQSQKGTVSQTEKITNADNVDFNTITPSADTANSFIRAENQGQAEAKAKAILYRSITKQNEGSLSMDGNPLMVAGINVSLTGFGVVSGKYHVVTSRHRIDKSSGYTTDVDVKRIAPVKDKAKEKAKKPARKAVTQQSDQFRLGVTPLTNSDGITFNTITGQ